MSRGEGGTDPEISAGREKGGKEVVKVGSGETGKESERERGR